MQEEKNKELEGAVEQEAAVEQEKPAVKESSAPAQAKKEQKVDKKKPKKKSKGGGFFSKIADVFAELKNVTWPKMPAVVKELGIVLAVTGSFLVVLMGIDFVMKLLYELLVKGLS